MADFEMANFYRPFCFLYIFKTFVCSLAIAAETRSCALSYGNDLKDDSTVCSELLFQYITLYCIISIQYIAN